MSEGSGSEPIVRLRFGGGRYGDCALDEAALREVLHFQEITARTAEVLWRRRNPNRKRLPRGFRGETALRLCALEQGSAVAVLDAPGASMSWVRAEPEFAAVPVEAAGVIHGVFGAVARGQPPPEEWPKSLLARYARLGRGLANGETLEIALPDAAPAPVTQHERARLLSFLEKSEDAALVSGSSDIMSTIDRIAAAIPDDVWETVPRDLSERRDYYIYGVEEK